MEQLHISDRSISGRPNYLSRGRYDNWQIEHVLAHLRNVSYEINEKPTKAILWHRINELGKDEPSPRFISSRIPFRRALELIGFPDVHSWAEDDYIHWGVRFIEANNGAKPSARTLDYLSKLKRGPSSSQIVRCFGKLNDYKISITEAYQSQIAEKTKVRQQKLSDIEEGLAEGGLTKELFVDVNSEEEMLHRYARFLVLDELLLGDNAKSKLSIATMSNKSVRANGFVGSIRKVNNAITAGDIESSALSLGVFDYIWPPDKSYLETLKIPEELITPNRKSKMVFAGTS